MDRREAEEYVRTCLHLKGRDGIKLLGAYMEGHGFERLDPEELPRTKWLRRHFEIRGFDDQTDYLSSYQAGFAMQDEDCLTGYGVLERICVKGRERVLSEPHHFFFLMPKDERLEEQLWVMGRGSPRNPARCDSKYSADFKNAKDFSWLLAAAECGVYAIADQMGYKLTGPEIMLAALVLNKVNYSIGTIAGERFFNRLGMPAQDKGSHATFAFRNNFYGIKAYQKWLDWKEHEAQNPPTENLITC